MDMKNWFLTFGILGMVMTTFAQDTVLSGKGTTKNGSAKSEMRAGEFYGRLVATKQTNTEIVRFKVDEIVYRMTRDVDLRSKLKAIEKHRFGSVLEALNVLASHGWELRSTMVVRGRQGDEQHFLMTYATEGISPVSPWLDRGSATNSRRQ